MKTKPVRIPAQVFAVFAVCKVGDKFCATTDPDGKVRGLPGGKVDSTDKSIFRAVERESKEEGWNLAATRTILQLKYVEGKLVAWVLCVPSAAGDLIVHDHKEKGRGIVPTLAYASQLSDFGNDFLSEV